MVLETNAAVKIRGAKQSHEHEDGFSELIGTLSFVGKLGGTLVIYCKWQQAVQLAAGMLGDPGGHPEPDTVRDAMGEMVNQIGGTIKRYIGADAKDLMLSPPVVVSGSPLAHCVRSHTKPVSVDLDLGEGTFGVCLFPS